MFTNILENAFDVFRVCCTCKVGENALVFRVRVHGEEEGTYEVFRCFCVVVLRWCVIELELWGLKLAVVIDAAVQS